jgi:threonine/homoserine/homoserine lactone efflux protein
VQEIFPLLGIAGAIAIGAVSPGPSFVMVARTAVASSRSDGVAAAFGIGAGGALYTIAALAGLQALFSAVPSLYFLLKFIGGIYLAFLGYQIWKGAGQTLDIPSDDTSPKTHEIKNSFLTGLYTQLSNPKAAIYYASVFAAFHLQDFSLILGLCTIVAIFIIEVGWYLLVALALSSAKPRDAYLRYKKWIDRSAGGVMVLLGIKLVTSVNQA